MFDSYHKNVPRQPDGYGWLCKKIRRKICWHIVRREKSSLSNNFQNSWLVQHMNQSVKKRLTKFLSSLTPNLHVHLASHSVVDVQFHITYKTLAKCTIQTFIKRHRNIYCIQCRRGRLAPCRTTSVAPQRYQMIMLCFTVHHIPVTFAL